MMMNKPENQAISTLTYVLIERKMGWYAQTTNRTVHHIHLYPTVISTESNKFKLEHVHDLSYKPFSGGTGLFYLHTNQGVFTFEVESNPSGFIAEYRKLRG